ncbi:hypothetical protein CAPTEDRAFT_127864, partial [Capitella teleta]
WQNRDWEVREYWGGATPESKACGCFMDNSCAVHNAKCNCANDKQLRIDEGYLTHTPDLPMTKFFAGDTGGAIEVGYHTLGPFTCYGENSPE